MPIALGFVGVISWNFIAQLSRQAWYWG